MEGRFISYIRVSTSKQGASGLGIEAQRKAILDYLNGGDWKLIAEYCEVESGKKTDAERPRLHAALEHCKRIKATLLIARLDRLARNAAFLLNLRDSGVDFKAVDMPQAEKVTVGLMAVMAEHVRDAISHSTKEALKAAKARGVRLGNPIGFKKEDSDRGRILGRQAKTKLSNEYVERMYPILKQYVDEGLSLRQIAAKMEELKELTPRGGSKWQGMTVKLIIDRYDKLNNSKKGVK